MKPSDRRAAAASYRRYVIGYALFILFRSYLMYTRPHPIRTSTLIAVIGFLFVLLLMKWLRYLRVPYFLLILGILIVELIARDTGVRSLFFLQGTLAILLAVLAFQKKELPA
jgi:hypothetical protein